MAPAAKRQKISRENPSNQKSIDRPDIRSFGKISKVTAKGKAPDPTSTAAKDSNYGIEELLNAAITKSSSKFRVDQLNNSSTNQTGYSSDVSSREKDDIKVTPQKRQRHRKIPLPEAETPTKGARTILGAFKISSPSSKGSSRLVSKSTTSTHEKQGELLPEPLQDLIRLYSSFLTALSLHFAHFGCLTPADLRQCTPSIERTWGKRSVELEDIKRLLGVADSCIDARRTLCATPRLSNFGNGRVCIELSETTTIEGVLARPLDEKKLNLAFEEKVNRLWIEWCSRRSNGSNVPLSKADFGLESALEFVNQLPKAPVHVCSSLGKMAPLLSKGQRRLEEFRIGALEKKAKAVEAADRPNTQKGKSAVDRKQALLSRMQAKERSTAALPQYTQAKRDEISAAQRLEEVVRLLDLLGGSADNSCITTLSSSIPLTKSSQRISLPLPTLLQHLKNSLKNPISREEGLQCVKLLADEIAPQWVSMVTMGKVVGVVLRKGGRPESKELRERIAKYT